MIVLDTHTWLWLVSEPKRVGPKVRNAGVGSLVLSAISAWEVATKVAQGRLSLDRPTVDWIVAAHDDQEIRSEPVSLPIAIRAGGLGAEGFHGDQADRIIVATAMMLRCPLASKDVKIREWASSRRDLAITW